MKAVIIIPIENINKHTNSTKAFTNFPAGTHSAYNISSFFLDIIFFNYFNHQFIVTSFFLFNNIRTSRIKI